MLSLKKGYKIRVKVHGKGGVFFPQQTSMASTFEINCRDRARDSEKDTESKIEPMVTSIIHELGIFITISLFSDWK